jgi:exodeoxyribonuclease-3
VLCLQETKCPDDAFPSAAFRKLGYEHMAIHGQKGYHGVAILSRLPLSDAQRIAYCGIADTRHVSAVVEVSGARRIRLHNFYVPAGGDEPDREANPKFAHKLDFIEEMRGLHAEAELDSGVSSILVGDLNIAPLETDVWSHKQLLKVVSHTPVETEKLTAMQQAGAWIDLMRTHIPPEEKVFTWWSYRARDWSAADRGRAARSRLVIRRSCAGFIARRRAAGSAWLGSAVGSCPGNGAFRILSFCRSILRSARPPCSDLH